MGSEADSRGANGLYNFRKPIPEGWLELSRSLLETLSATAAFQRLKRIRFLGAIDYTLIKRPDYKRGNVRHTRYHHSRGVARLAIDYAAKVELEKDETLTLIAAALLHDVGHAPLSHSVEPVFKKLFGVGHHEATEAIIKGDTAIGREVHGVLRAELIDIDRVLALISGSDNSFHSFFSGPINFDTIEGILRSYSYIARSPQIPNPHYVVDAAMRRLSVRDRDVVDQFWHYKDRVYRSIVNSRDGLVADYLCQLTVFANAKSLSVEDYFLTDERFFHHVPGLKEVLASTAISRLAAAIPEDVVFSRERRFYVDSQFDFFLRDDRRYQQTRRSKQLADLVVDVSALERSSFDDDISRQLSLFD